MLSLALEIALKAWQRRERQGAPDRSHDLLQLFEGLEEATQKRLEAKMPPMVDPLVGETLREGLRELLESTRPEDAAQWIAEVQVRRPRQPCLDDS